MCRTPRWLKTLGWKLYRIYFRYFPRFSNGLFHIDANDKHQQMFLLTPGDQITVHKDDYLVEAEFLNLFGVVFVLKVHSSLRVTK